MLEGLWPFRSPVMVFLFFSFLFCSGLQSGCFERNGDLEC